MLLARGLHFIIILLAFLLSERELCCAQSMGNTTGERALSVLESQLSLGDSKTFVQCASGGEHTITVFNSSVAGVFVDGSYSIDWGDGQVLSGITDANFPTEHTYEQRGTYTLTFSARTVGGVSVSRTYEVYNDRQPALGFNISESGTLCANSRIQFTINNYNENSDSTKYVINYGDGHEVKYTAEEMRAVSGVFGYTYPRSHCDNPETKKGFTIRVSAQNVCPDPEMNTRVIEMPGVRVVRPPEIRVNIPDKACTGSEVRLSNNTLDGSDASCGNSNTSFFWDFGDGTAIERAREPRHVYDSPGRYTITVKARSSAGCDAVPVTRTIDVIESIFVNWSISTDTVCVGKTVALRGQVLQGHVESMYWFITPDENVTVVAGSRNTETADVVFNEYGVYHVWLGVTGLCSPDPRDTTIVVKKDPVVTIAKSDSICPGSSYHLSSTLVHYEWNAWDGQEGRPEWTVSPASGWHFLSEEYKYAKHPIIVFDQKGDYTVRVAIPGAGCDKSEVTASQVVSVRDTALVRDITVEKSTVCAGNTLKFTSGCMSQGEIHYSWQPSFMSCIGFEPGSGASSPSPVMKFPIPGTFVVPVTVRTACVQWNKDFEILVKKDPEVRIVLEDAICPGVVDFGSDVVIYGWYNNVPRAVWTVVPDAGTPADGAVFVTSATDIYPQIDFKKPGGYTVTVTLDSVGCLPVPQRSHFTKKVRVYNNSKTLEVSANTSDVCVNGKVVFTNSSTVAEADIVTYEWSVTPATGWSFSPGSSATESAPSIQFTVDGKYTVNSKIRTCDTKDTNIVITVYHNPEVILRDTSLCPGTYGLGDFAKFVWYNNAKQADWEVVKTGISRDAYSGLNPEVTFSPGEYFVSVRLPFNANCPFDKSLATGHFVVYDTAVTVDVMPSGREVCEGEQVTFVNKTSNGKSFTYQWSVEKADGYVFVAGEAGRTEVSPVIRFDAFAEYPVRVRVTTEGGCNIREHVESITVRGVPEVDFKNLSKICVNTDLQVTTDNVEYANKGCDLTYEWLVSPANGVTIDDASASFPKLSFTKNDNYVVMVNVTGQCGGKRSFTQTLHVIKTEVVALASSVAEGCTDNLVPQLVNVSTGDSLSYKWTVTPADGWAFQGTDNAFMKSPFVVISASGDYHVELEVSNICTTDTKEFDIRAYSSPVVTADDITHVCERGFEFIGAERLTIDVQNDPVNKVEWSVAPAGVTYINGTSSTFEEPDLTFVNGEYTMTGQYWNGCPSPGVVTIHVMVDSFPEIVPLRDTVVCSKTSPFLLTAFPDGGVWTNSTPGIIMQEVSGDYYFDPYIDADADYQVFYTLVNESCVSREDMSVHTHKLPVVNAGADTDICINNPPRTLVAVEPVVGGWWEGSGVTSDGLFTPDVVGARDLTYSFTAGVTGCTNSDVLTMTVWGLPSPQFAADSQYCLYSDALFRPLETGVGHLFEWDFGDFIIETSTGDVTHAYQDFGYRDVVMNVLSVHGCRDTSEAVRIEVVNLPPAAVFSIDRTEGCGPHRINATIEPADYTDKNLHFAWNFADQVMTDTLMPPNPVTLQAGAWDTTYNVRFTVYNICDTKKMDVPVSVYSSPKAEFVLMHEWECSPVDVMIKNNSTGNGSRYSWDFGDGETSVVFNPKHLFTTDSVTTIYDVMLIATNRCGVDTNVQQLAVRPQTLTAFFQTPKRNICVGEEICFTNHSSDSARNILTKKWDFGDGSIDSTWNSCHVFRREGMARVHLFIDNGCGFDTISDQLMVHSLPVLKIESEDNLCENDTFRFHLVNDRDLLWQRWDLGDSTFSAFKDVLHRYDGSGKFRVKVTGVSQSRGECLGEAYKEVDIWPNPQIIFRPLDTIGCSPILYKPEVEGEGFLMWNYGDGSDVTSAGEHLYENKTDEVNSYKIQVQAQSDKGCRSDYVGDVTVYNVPRVGISSRTTLGKPQVVEFINLSESYDDCIWYLPFGQTIHSFENQKVAFEQSDLYTVALVARNRYGCQDSISYDYQSVIKGMYFANTFMPHSSDPKVSRFNAVAEGIREYKLEIYDQYGNKVWETSELEGDKPSSGWDGRNSRGELMPQAVYIWRAKAIFLDDQVWTGDNDSGVKQSTQGTVMLLRP